MWPDQVLMKKNAIRRKRDRQKERVKMLRKCLIVGKRRS